MVAIGFAFDDLDFVINPFKCCDMDEIVTVIKNIISIMAKHLQKLHRLRLIL